MDSNDLIDGQDKSDVESSHTAVPTLCKLQCTDYFITICCVSMLLITFIGYIKLFTTQGEVEPGNTHKQNSTILDFPFPIDNNSTWNDGEYQEFYLKCRVSVEKHFLMGCNRIEAHLVMKDTERLP